MPEMSGQLGEVLYRAEAATRRASSSSWREFKSCSKDAPDWRSSSWRRHPERSCSNAAFCALLMMFPFRRRCLLYFEGGFRQNRGGSFDMYIVKEKSRVVSLSSKLKVT